MEEQKDINPKPQKIQRTNKVKPTIIVDGCSQNYIDIEYGKSIQVSLNGSRSILGRRLPYYRLCDRYRYKGDPCFIESLSDSEIDLLLMGERSI